MTTTHPKASEELKSCPFCGAAAGFGDRSYKTPRKSGVQHGYTAHCMNPNCFAVVAGLGSFDTHAEAITAWNTRTPPTATEEAVAREPTEAMIVAAMKAMHFDDGFDEASFERLLADEQRHKAETGAVTGLRITARNALRAALSTYPVTRADETGDGCAHCGGDPECIKGGDKVHPYRVVCKNCGAQTALHGDFLAAWKAWKRRPLRTPAPDSREAVLERVVHENGTVVVDFMGDGLAWRPLDYGTWQALTPSKTTADQVGEAGE